MLRIALILPLLLACGEKKIIEGIEVDSDDPVGDTISEAVLFPLDWKADPVTNSLGMFRISRDDIDVFALHVVEPATLLISSWGSASVQGQLMDEHGAILQESDGFFFTAKFEKPGFYYLVVSTDDEKVDFYGLEVSVWEGGAMEFGDPNKEVKD
ncbi:MAG: hypothetical protein OXE49_19095 [Gemmatimonadetes bacterium]|nr:hypothetical protein [Gemmatimonadota bacterium]